MDNYTLGDLAQPYQPEDEIIDNFRTAAADIISTVDINPYTQKLRDIEAQANLSQLGDPSMMMGMSGPMMGQMVDPAMMPPEMLSQPPQMGMPPAQDPMMGQMDPMGGQQADLMNNPGMNNLGI